MAVVFQEHGCESPLVLQLVLKSLRSAAAHAGNRRWTDPVFHLRRSVSLSFLPTRVDVKFWVWVWEIVATKSGHQHLKRGRPAGTRMRGWVVGTVAPATRER